jgi:hypothetical protein
MAVTLAQARNFVQDKLYQGIIDEFRKDDLLNLMIFDDCVAPQGRGSSLRYLYDRVTTYGTAAFRALNTPYVAAEAETTQYVANLAILGGSFEIDRVVQLDTPGIIDEVTFQLGQKINAAKALFSDTVINGDTANDILAFDGLNKALTGTSTEIAPLAAIDLSTAANVGTNWQTFLDGLRRWMAKLDGTPNAFLVNREMLAVFQAIADRSTQIKISKNEFGNEITHWGATQLVALGDKPGTSNPIIPVNAQGETSIYAVRIGLDGVHCVSPKGSNVVQTYLPNWADPGAVKLGEVEMVTAVVLKATRAAGKFTKIKIQ